MVTHCRRRAAATICRLAGLAMLVPGVSGWTDGAARVDVSTYGIAGRSHAEVVGSVRRHGPKSGRAYGIGFIDFHPSYSVEKRDGQCRLHRASVGLRVALKIPEWRGPADAPRAVVRFAAHFVRTIEAHEMQHVAIARGFQARIRSELLRLPAQDSCYGLRDAARKRIAALKTQHQAAQRQFDLRTAKQIRRLL